MFKNDKQPFCVEPAEATTQKNINPDDLCPTISINVKHNSEM